ncbi:hypothetical protein Hrd1104_03485 [Halorhabdus sp. CBA1104]|uniref:DUF7835 family putative zinc beta-ribbon protein n=1 Tax=unclassified Halorhabdus TaxID=2621901 RepID=UPI0012B3F0B3|nr:MULTISPECIES: hypothetical protein [unclassified Halorhabdus]QGN06448.1 hypothetical protein Hrd1104_03485 [Halorhabdus sp. CBA1104]
MASTDHATDSMMEYCPSCGTDQPHAVSLTLVTESDDRTNAAFSREPYRVRQCRVCGRETRRRMNDA